MSNELNKEVSDSTMQSVWYIIIVYKIYYGIDYTYNKIICQVFFSWLFVMKEYSRFSLLFISYVIMLKVTSLSPKISPKKTPKTTISSKKTTWSRRRTSSSSPSKSSSKTLASKHWKQDYIGKKLIIVESPWKVKTISKYVWSDYIVKPSVWHIVDLVDKNMDTLIKKWFEPDYEIDPDKKSVVTELKSASKASSQVILATDEDREWEAISFHLCSVLWLDPKTTPRIVFNEITESAIRNALDKPRRIDMSLVSAQKSRAVLDKLVWFSISPVLWSKIKRWLSAGRVQSVAVKLVVEKEREIKAFIPTEFYTLKALLQTKQWEVVISLNKFQSDSWSIVDLDEEWEWNEKKSSTRQSWWKFSKSAIKAVLEQLWLWKPSIKKDEKTWYELRTWDQSIQFILDDIVTKQSKKSPPAPFITSTLQQTASRLFGRPVKSVMSAAQKLYEAWLITYMRTDSVTLSGTALAQCTTYITKTFWPSYHQVRQYKGKSKNAQEAHEAIRPTSITNLPEQISLWSYEQKLYKLIWQRTVASQMADAVFTNTSYVFYPVV